MSLVRGCRVPVAFCGCARGCFFSHTHDTPSSRLMPRKGSHQSTDVRVGNVSCLGSSSPRHNRPCVFHLRGYRYDNSGHRCSGSHRRFRQIGDDHVGNASACEVPCARHDSRQQDAGRSRSFSFHTCGGHLSRVQGVREPAHKRTYERTDPSIVRSLVENSGLAKDHILCVDPSGHKPQSRSSVASIRGFRERFVS